MNFPNLLVNSGLEHGDLSGWVSFSSACTASQADKNSGAWCAAGTGYADLRQTIPCWANTSYTTTTWVKGVSSGLFAVINILDTGGTTIVSSSALPITTSWTQVSFTWNSGAHTAVQVDYALSAYSGSSVSVYWDDLATYPAGVVGVNWSPSANPWPVIFSDDFSNPALTIDSAASGHDGFNWYPQMFFGLGTNPSSYWSVSGGELQINNSVDKYSDTLHTARPGPAPNGYYGTTFSGGNGIYFEARIRFLNLSSISTNGWPSFWLDAQEFPHPTMPGNPGTTEALEMDIMEYFPTAWTNGDPRQFNMTIHDWISGTASTPSVGNINWLPAGTDVTQYHAYGMLWIPASSANNWIGYVQSFFDGVPGPAYCWKGNQTYSGVIPPTQSSTLSTGYLGSQIDNQWLMLILGASQGGIPTIGIDSVKVWAANPAGSIRVINQSASVGSGSWNIGQTQSFTLMPFTGVKPWFIRSVVATGYTSFESAQIGIDDYLNVPDWDNIPNLGPGPSLHSQWTPGATGVVSATKVQSMIPQLLALSNGGSEEPSFTGPPPLSGGEMGPVTSSGAPSGFRLLRPRKPPTA